MERFSQKFTMAENMERLEHMHILRDEVFEIEKDQAPDIGAVERVRHIVRDSETCVDATGGQMEMIIDSQIILAGQNVLKGAVQNVDTNIMPFSLEDFVTGIENYMLQANTSQDGEWESLSSDTYLLFKSAPRFNFKLGTFKLDPPPNEKKEPQKRMKKSEKTEKAVVEAISENEPEKVVKQYGEHILKCLVRKYRANNRTPVNYFQFLLDPNDFWRSVHNVYYFSHLVKDNKVKMLLDENKLPVVEPMAKPQDASQPSSQQQIQRRSQFNFRMTPYEYRELLQTFNIVEAAIPPI